MNVRLKHLARIAVSNVDKKNVSDEQSVRLCNYTDVYYNERITADLPFMEATASVEQIERFGLRANDVLLTKDSETPYDIAIPAYVVADLPDVVCGYHLALLRPSRVDGRYLFWALASRTSREQFSASANGITRFGLRYDSFGEVRVPLPPPARQRAIADYLDRETARIDALIEKKGRIMGLLEERTRVLIDDMTHASRVGRVRHVTSLCTSGPRGWADRVGGEGSPFIRSANLKRDSINLSYDDLAHVIPPDSHEARRSEVEPGDVLVGITGANTGWVGRVDNRFAGGYVSQHVAILRPAGIEPDWLAYSLFSPRVQDQLLGGQYGGTKQQLGLDDLVELRIGLPQVEDQRIRVAKMDAARRILEALSDRLTRQVEALKEHRQALITAVVTGDLEVAGVAA